MIRVLHLVGGAFPRGYRSDDMPDPWQQGVEREVTPQRAAYLLSTFPESFVEAKAEPTEPAKKVRKPSEA